MNAKHKLKGSQAARQRGRQTRKEAAEVAVMQLRFDALLAQVPAEDLDAVLHAERVVLSDLKASPVARARTACRILTEALA